MTEYINKEKIMKRVNDITDFSFPHEVIGDYEAYKQYNEGWSDACKAIMGMLMGAPSEEVAPIVHAKWYYDINGHPYCSECGNYTLNACDGDFHCGYCGAKMDLED